MELNHTNPTTVVPEKNLIPVTDTFANMADIPPSRMFLIKGGLKVFQDANPGEHIFDASQGDGGASLPGVSPEILERAYALQQERGTSYDMPFGTEPFRRSVVEDYWSLDSSTGLGPANIAATVGGRDALVKAYSAMLALGHGRTGDLIVVSRVPWISYNWGPYGVGANVLLAPGEPESGWSYTEESLEECVKFAESIQRKIAAVIITNPDNPTGNTISPERQITLAKKVLNLGVPFVLLDWMYHYVTDEEPMDLNRFVVEFTPEERERLMFLDGLTKSLGGSNIRNAHLIASESVIRYIVARASHSVIPSYFSMAVAMAAYEKGYKEASRTISDPTNASRKVLQEFLDQNGFEYILGKGYYAFIRVDKWLEAKGWETSEPLGAYLAEQYGLAIVPGAFFSVYGGDWIRFSYATPTERTAGAAKRLKEGLDALISE